MTEEKDHFDIIIVGGGPAGSCAALRLLELGYRVALIEERIFPRNQIGESLSPGIVNIFDYLQAGHLLNDSQYLRGLAASVIWESQSVNNVIAAQRGPGVMVDRGKLDQDMVELALGRGLYLFQPAKFQSAIKIDNEWQVNLLQDGKKITLSSIFVLDGRGRKGAGTRERILLAPAGVALWVNIPAVLLPNETLVEAVTNGWLWGSPTTDCQFRIMAYIDPDEVKGNAFTTVFGQLISNSVLFRSAADIHHLYHLYACPVVTYCHDHPWNDKYIKIGESAFTLDPLSSTGVEKAMRLSLQAVIAIHTAFLTGDESMPQTFYESRVIESVCAHSQWTADYYAQAWPGKSFRFWRDHSTVSPKAKTIKTPFHHQLESKLNDPRIIEQSKPSAQIHVSAALRLIWNTNVRLSSDLAYLQVPCVVGDHLEFKGAVKHPNIAREITYLEEIELIPLLKIIHEVETFGVIITRWSKLISFEQAARTGIYLYHRGLLCNA
ncbi:NAD(P)/FAD-dependent oxidoreductase [Mucilaginibacter lappiensis]|uniref:MnmG N-terminal domain-containing protein n=1 Tax=Mucilaginibacter lappiensis TaxID=354630 RepID=A0A841JJ38_9SPHI|nr:tryptophan 7-halogenase [Mucilaginibacter lappiensis]MBB6130947.1 hypothetical protein [Mucilaginibacter lappiensis]